MPGIVIQPGNAARTTRPLRSLRRAQHAGGDELAAQNIARSRRGRPSRPARDAMVRTGGVPSYDDLPQYSRACALKICEPLMNIIVSATTLIQCMTRTGSLWR